MHIKSLKESDLYEPIRIYLEHQEYRVNAEVRDCDMTATRGDELVIIELKTRFNATLLIQAVERQKSADAVYVALPYPKDVKQLRNWRGMCHLLKRLEIGLILVHFLKSGTRVEIAFHPMPYTKRRNYKRRNSIIREIHERSGEYNTGGSNGKRLVTSYREEAIHIAYILSKHTNLSPAELKKLGTGARTQSILAKNFYGWFDRIERGRYRLHPHGKAALSEYPEIVEHFSKKI